MIDDIIYDLRRRDPIVISMILCIIGIVVLGTALVYADHNEQQRWEQFKEENNCVVTGHIKGKLTTEVRPYVGPNGSVSTVVVPSKSPDFTKYECDDGKEYIR